MRVYRGSHGLFNHQQPGDDAFASSSDAASDRIKLVPPGGGRGEASDDLGESPASSVDYR
jgi:hypothetical protein